MESREVLDWAAERLNSQGGIGNAPVELVYKDTFNRNILSLAREFAEDRSIQIVIGPQKSSELHAAAPLFIQSQKLLISPMSTAGDILRAYGGKNFIWRTCQSDVAQIR
jgi:ABC-type branched-subunit amino acid transport system substrate-binding protein